MCLSSSRFLPVLCKMFPIINRMNRCSPSSHLHFVSLLYNQAKMNFKFAGDVFLICTCLRVICLTLNRCSPLSSFFSWEKNPADFEPYHLKLEECMSADQIPTTEHIQGYVKKVRTDRLASCTQ